MPKSKTNKSHKARVSAYKANNKKNQEILKKKMMEDYIKMQTEIMASQAHTSTEDDVIYPEIDIDDLNMESDFIIELEPESEINK